MFTFHVSDYFFVHNINRIEGSSKDFVPKICLAFIDVIGNFIYFQRI